MVRARHIPAPWSVTTCMTRHAKKFSGDLINGMQMCCLWDFLESYGHTPEERERIFSELHDAIEKDIREFYAKAAGDGEDEWIQKASEMGVMDVK